MEKAKNQTLHSELNSTGVKETSKGKFLEKLEGVFKINFDPLNFYIRWRTIIEQSKDSQKLLKYIEQFFSHHDKFSAPIRWEAICKEQEALPLQEGIIYLTAVIEMGEAAYLVGLQSYGHFGSIVEPEKVYQNIILNAESRIQWTRFAMQITERRGISQSTDIKRLIELCGDGSFDKPPLIKVIDKEYVKLNTNHDRRDFLELLIAQLCPIDGIQYRQLLYKLLFRFREIVHDIEREKIITAFNPKYNGSDLIKRVSHFFKDNVLSSTDEEEIRKEVIKINETLALKKNDTEKSSLMITLLPDYQGKETLVSKVIAKWLKLEYDSLTNSSENSFDPLHTNPLGETIFKQVVWTSTLTDLGILINDLKKFGLIREKTTNEEIASDFLIERKIGTGKKRKKITAVLDPDQVDSARKRKHSGSHKPSKEMEEFRKSFSAKIVPK